MQDESLSGLPTCASLPVGGVTPLRPASNQWEDVPGDDDWPFC